MKPKVDLSGNADKRHSGLDGLLEGDVANVNVNKVDVNNDTNVNVNKNVNIVINKKADDIDDIIRQTYYLRMSTIKRIKKLSKVADMGVSEFLQTVLDNVLDNIKIE